MASNFQILPTPSQEEFMFSVRVADTKVRQNLFLSTGKQLTSAVTANANGTSPTTYAEFSWAVNHEKIQVDTAFYSYVYLKCDKPDADHMNFYFGKPKTAEQRNTPFQKFWDTRQYTWPAVLEDLYAVQTNKFPQTSSNGVTTFTASSIFPRYKYRPSVPYNSLILVEQFLSTFPWPSSDLIHEQPVPTDINGSYIGVNMEFPRCLHDKMVFQEKVPAAVIIYGVGSVTPPPSRYPNGQIFPATNFTDWAEFFIEDRQQSVNGLWLRERVKIFPPPIPEPVFQ